MEPDLLRALRHRPLVFVDDLDAPHLDEADHHHLSRVLRLSDGAAITLGDGAGAWREARFARSDLTPEPIGDVHPADVDVATTAGPGSPRPSITIAFAPVKGDRPEWVVQKLTELGIDEIVPVTTVRSVVRWDGDRAARQHARLTKITREACLQSRRLRLPVIAPLTPLASFLSAHPEAVLADPAGPAMASSHRTIIIGPEGGFSDDELAGANTVALPGNILRAETAAIVAGTIACAFRARIL